MAQKESHAKLNVFRNGLETRTTFVCVCGGSMYMTLLVSTGYFYPPVRIGPLTVNKNERAHLTGAVVMCDVCQMIVPVSTFWKQ